MTVGMRGKHQAFRTSGLRIEWDENEGPSCLLRSPWVLVISLWAEGCQKESGLQVHDYKVPENNYQFLLPTTLILS